MMGKVAITAGGMASSLSDLRNGCASARAGMTRTYDHWELSFFDKESGDMEPVTVQPAWGDMFNGYSGEARLLRLAQFGFHDFLQSLNGRKINWGRTAFLINMPSTFYQKWHTDKFETFVDFEEIDRTTKDIQDRFIPKLLNLFDIKEAPAKVETISEDGCGIAVLLRRAEELLANHSVERCIIGGVDSLVDTELLAQLMDLGLLISPLSNSGFSAGEGAAFLLIERTNTDSKAWALIETPHISLEQTSYNSTDKAQGHALSAVIQEVLNRSATPDETKVIVGNFNGMENIAYEWGCAQVILQGAVGKADDWHPANHFGETGAVSGFFATAHMFRALIRNYANSEQALLWQNSPVGRRSAFMMYKGDYRER